MKQLAPGLFTLTTLPLGRAYLLEGSDGLTMLDAGFFGAGKTIVKELVQSGRSPTDVKRILITHAHPDHIGGLKELQLLTGATVIASAGERSVIEGKDVMMPQRQIWKDTVMVGRVIAEGDVIAESLGSLTTISTPGHTAAHVSFWQPETRILFSGDVLINWWGLALPLAPFTVDMRQDRHSIMRVAELAPSIVCFGHGPALVENAAEKLMAFAKKQAA